ncbi:siphovirus Gp157 family protein [Claveliimonas bilis]|uniref:Siphovirus Gp157 family protein n=1 Tax=Claveliimonas bilis TaxID=3028070 RepID=A0ABM8I2M7_9FIRM|nr:siphovirus Gp157 family protein [Claveliimonas bilis]BDZ77223.1 hypothetical protein Lac1_14060 [Claveliimonas bilis]BDZ78854.1 hypothetical protein Lac3_00630 [Claveliimonas bilis]
MTLYELTERELALLDLMEDPNTDKEDLNLLIEASDQEFGRKLDAYATIRDRMLSDADMISKEINRLQKIKKAIEESEDSLKESIIMSIRALGKAKYETKLRTFLVKDCAPKLIVDDQEAVPAEYLVKQPDKINNAKLKKYLTEHGDEDCEYAHLESVQSLAIK